MPELPEVETIKRGLEPILTGSTLKAIERRNVQPSQHPRGQMYIDDGIEEQLVGSAVAGFRRRGKGLIIDFDSDWSMVVHLKMTGQIILVPVDAESPDERFGGGHPTKSMTESLPDNTTRSVLTFENGDTLYFNDQRKFGWIKVMPTSEVENEPFIASLGPEPWSERYSGEYLEDTLANRTIAIKSALLDQHVVAGIGNIYADEALNLAQINPERPANSLESEQYQTLVDSTKTVIEQSIEQGGTSFSHYVNHLGTFGDYLTDARVYGREGEPCKHCGADIIKTKLNGRGTHFCSNCQK